MTGIGSSKRIVVWDTTIAKMNTPQIVFVAGHETGHYVLYHIPKGLALAAAVFLGLFYLGYLSIGWVLARWGTNWEIRGVGDWAAFPALLLLLTIFSFAADPLANAISRHYEHQADQYGLEVTHGLTPDSGEVAAQSFQILGEVDLSDPAPNPVDVFLFYDHPPISDASPLLADVRSLGARRDRRIRALERAPTIFVAPRRAGVVRGYEENLYTAGRIRASTCSCKEKCLR